MGSMESRHAALGVFRLTWLLFLRAAYMSCPCHIELTLTEKEAPVKGEADGKEKKLSKVQRARALRSGVVSKST